MILGIVPFKQDFSGLNAMSLQMHKMLSLPQSSKGERQQWTAAALWNELFVTPHVGTGEIAAETFFSFTLTDNLRSPQNSQKLRAGR